MVLSQCTRQSIIQSSECIADNGVCGTFLRNVILGETNELRNRSMLVIPRAAPAQRAITDTPKGKFCTLNCTLKKQLSYVASKIIPKRPKKNLPL